MNFFSLKAELRGTVEIARIFFKRCLSGFPIEIGRKHFALRPISVRISVTLQINFQASASTYDQADVDNHSLTYLA